MATPVKLHPINPCFNVDGLINTYVRKHRDQSRSPQYINSIHKTPKKNSTRARSSTFKSSLTDWRSLYQDPMPQTQSLIGAFSNQKANERIRHRRHESSKGFLNKQRLVISPVRTTRQFWERTPKSKQELGAKTSINFYQSPMSQQLEALGNLTARMDQKSFTHKSFWHHRTRKTSHFNLENYAE